MASTARRDHRKRILIGLLLIIMIGTLLQLGIDTGVIRFYLAYVVPPFIALVATFVCALINILFYRFFKNHHLKLLYLATSLPFILFTISILTHFFEDRLYSIIAIIISVCSLSWYVVLFRRILGSATVEK